MKKSDLRRIIQEEIEKILSEAPLEAPTREKEKIETEPSIEDDEFGIPKILPEPKKATKPQDAAKKISEKIAKRYTDILKKKKNA
jgi:hypothetical protein